MKRLIRQLVLMAGLACMSQAQQPTADQDIVIGFKILDVGRAELDAVLRANEAYLPVVQTFTLIGIKVDTGRALRRYEGFFKSSDSTYIIDFLGGRAEYAGRYTDVSPIDYIARDTAVYLRTGFISALFGLDMRYYPRRVQVELKSSHLLPIYRAARRKQTISSAASKLALGEPDIVYGRIYDAIGGTRLDWSALSRFSRENFIGSRYTLSLGAALFGGDFTGRIVGVGQPHVNRTSSRGRMRIPVFESMALRQIVIGDFVSYGLLPREMTGLELTNRPPSVRRVFAREVFSGQFEPQVDVSLSGGLEGVQLQQTDNLGMYQLDAPVLYGQGLLEVHAFDQWGQEQILRYRMNIPRTLIPPGEVEYSVAVGRFRPPSNLTVSTNYVNWGVTSDLSIGAKVDYYDLADGVPKGYVGVTATGRISRSLVFNGLVVPTAFARAGLDWVFPSSAGIAVQHVRFGRNSFFNAVRMLDETDLTVSFPITLSGSRFSLASFVSRTHFTSFRDDELQVSMSGFFSVFSPRVSMRVLERTIYDTGTLTEAQQSDLSLGILLPASLLFRSQISYNHLSRQVESINADAVKRFSSGLLFGISYFRLPAIETYSIGLRVQYYFPFARAQVAVATPGPAKYEYTMAGSGSVGLSFPTSDVFFDNHPNYVGYGGFVLHPFLDANGNGLADPGESSVEKGHFLVSNLNAGGGRRITAANDFKADRIIGYEEYNIFLDPQSLENPIWVAQYGTVRVVSEPNFIKRVDVPIVNGGFVRGTITIAGPTPLPAEAIKLAIKAVVTTARGARKYTRSTTTFSTGEFEFSSVPPGRYTIELDAAQLETLGYAPTPQFREVQIVIKPDGDVVASQDFHLVAK